MKTWFLARWLTIPAAAVTVAVVLTADPGEGRATDAADGWPEYTDAATDEYRQRLDDRQRQILARVLHKEALVTALIEGRTTLAAVADEFLRLNRDYPITLEMVRLQFPGETDEEKHAYNVIAFARRGGLPAARKAEILARLAREFEALFGHPPIGS
jgi:hypothetical protein